MKQLVSIFAPTARHVLYLAIVFCSVNATSICNAFLFRNIIDTNTAAPSGLYTSFRAPAISGNAVAFHGSYSGGDGIFITSGGPITTVAITGDSTPSGTFVAFSDPSFSDGVAVFRAFSENGQSVYIGSGGEVTDLGYSVGREPAISGGNVVFTTSIGVVAGSPGSLSAIVRPGDAAPEGSFLYFGYPAISGNNVSFYGGYLKEDGEEGEGVFTSDGSVVTTIIDRDGPAAFSYGPTSISGNTVAFYSQLSNGIYKGSGGAITTIVEEGDPALNGVLGGFGNPSISGGTVAFWGAGTGGSGIFLGSGGPLTPVITTGDPLFGSTVVELFSGSFALDPHGGSRLAFQYRLADGRSGIAIAFPVPEPGTLLLLFLAILAGLQLRTPLQTKQRQ